MSDPTLFMYEIIHTVALTTVFGLPRGKQLIAQNVDRVVQRKLDLIDFEALFQAAGSVAGAELAVSPEVLPFVLAVIA
jgi:hypothetical protein